MEALIGLVAVALISLAMHCYTKADERLKKRILIFNGVIYGIFIILLLLYFHQEMKIQKYPDKYKVYSGDLFRSWTYEGSDQEYYYIYKTSFLSGGDNYVVPKSNCKLSPIARIRGIVELKLFALPDTNIYYDNKVKVDGDNYTLVDSVVMIEPDYYYLILYYTFIAVIILLIYNSVTLLIINDQNDSKSEQSDSEVDQVEQNSSEANPPAQK